MKRIESLCRDHFTAVIKAKKAKDLASEKAKPATNPFVSPEGTGRMTHADGIVEDMKQTPEDAYGVLESQSTPMKKRVMTRLAEGMNELDSLKEKLACLKDKPTALDMLDQFESVLTNQSFVNQAKQSKEVSTTGSLAPRSCGFDDLNVCSQLEITSVMGAIATRIAQILLP